MTALLSWFAMHGYGVYIWPSYGLVFFVLAMNVVLIKKQGHRTRRFLRQWFKQS